MDSDDAADVIWRIARGPYRKKFFSHIEDIEQDSNIVHQAVQLHEEEGTAGSLMAKGIGECLFF